MQTAMGDGENAAGKMALSFRGFIGDGSAICSRKRSKNDEKSEIFGLLYSAVMPRNLSWQIWPSPGMQQTQNLSDAAGFGPAIAAKPRDPASAPMLELRNIVQQELQTNPVLEEDVRRARARRTGRSSKTRTFKEEFNQLAKLDEEWREYMAQNSGYNGRSDEDEERRQFFFDSIANQETLQQHLIGQINGAELTPNDHRLAELIIGNIDDNGFLQTTPEEMSANTGVLDRRTCSRILIVDHPEFSSAGRRRARFAATVS